MKKYMMTGIMLAVLLLGMSTAVASDPPTLVAYTITNTTIEPPQTTSIDVAFSEYVSATITIENACGDLVKELYSSSKVKNPKAKTWDGTYTDDTAVPDGTYTVNVTGVNTTTGLSVINTSETITVVTSGDTTAPTVTASTPTGTDVAISTVITATFSEAMNQTSVKGAFSISPAINGSLGWDNDTMTFTPDADLAYDTTYSITIGTGAEGLADNALAADYAWDFTTESSETTTDTVTRTLQATASPDDTIMVSLTIDFDDPAAVDRLVITEIVPDEWVIVDASDSGNLASAGKITWMAITAIGGTIPDDGAVFTYNVTIPTDASGLHSFSGVYGTNVAGTDLDVLGDVDITIDGDELPTLVAYTITNRTITPPQTTSIDVAFSEYVSATITIENASGNLVKELYSSADVKDPGAKTWDGTCTDGAVVPDGTYTVNVTGVTTAGLSVINTSETITVQTSVSDIDTVTRTLQATASPGDTIMVSLTIDFKDQAAVDRLVITETVPDGWVIVDASDSGNTATTGKITWMAITAIGGTIPEDGAVFTYNVTVPDASGLQLFSGVYGTNVAGTDLCVLGNTDITISGDTCEVCDDGVDNDGDGLVDCDDPDCSVDVDGDGYYALPCGSDCDDTDAAVNPNATEVCNGIDDNCDGQIDEGCSVCDFHIELDAGWNFVSVPKKIAGANDAVAVFNLDPATDTCEYYDASMGSCIEDPANIHVVPCRGYMVYKASPETICINWKESTGAAPPPAQQLYAGWNMIGHINMGDMPIDDGTGADFGSRANIEDKFSQIWQWSQGSGWESCYPSGTNIVTAGQGYWIWMNEDALMSGTP